MSSAYQVPTTLTETPTPTELSLAPEAELGQMSGGVETLEAAYYWSDGDGNMVKSEVNGVIAYYVGKHYEKQVRGSQQNERKYYFAGANRIAMLAPQGCSAALRKSGTLTWLVSDHLGSTTVTANASGNLLSSLRYTAFGEVRAAGGTTSTDYRYTGQREDSYINLTWMGSR